MGEIDPSEIVPPQQARFWGLTTAGSIILHAVTYYYNGNSTTVNDEEWQLATHTERPLEDMFQGVNVDYADVADAHERLLRKELLQEEYICRRKIDWSPTEEGLQAIRDCMDPSEKLLPPWADTDVEHSHPLCGDPNEGLLHRKGVEIAGHKLPKMAWAHDPRGHPYGIEWYPDNDEGEACHDLHITTNEYMNDLGVEVITASNNTDHLTKKWLRYQREDRDTFWIFDNRETACHMFNALHDAGHIILDGRFQNVQNWGAKNINRKVWRASTHTRGSEPTDVVHTITGLLEGDRDKIQALFEDFHSAK